MNKNGRGSQEYKKTIGRNIKRIIKSNNTSEKELAEYIHYTPQHIKNIECGCVGASTDFLIAMCNQLNVSIEEIFVDLINVQSSIDPRIANILCDCTGDEIEILISNMLNDKKALRAYANSLKDSFEAK